MARIAPTNELQAKSELEGATPLKYRVLSLRKGERKELWRVMLGWALNWAIFLALLQVHPTSYFLLFTPHILHPTSYTVVLMLLQTFLFYACDFAVGAEDQEGGYLAHRELLLSWTWSIAQRVIFNEPLVIVSARGLPMLLRSRACACLLNEACVEYLAQGIEAFGEVVRAIMG